MGRFLRRKRVVETPTEGVWQVPTRFNFARDVVEAYAADPLRPALTFVDRDGVIDRRTFAEIAADANRWAGLLRARGLAPGDRLLVLVGKTPSWHGVLLGALKAGLVTVPCSEQLRSRDLDFRAEHSGAKLVVADRARAAEVARMDVPLDVVIVEDVKAELRELSALQPTWDTGPDDIAFILYTSGTTKDPKGATHTHGYTWAKRLQAEHWLDARPGDLVWCTAGTGWAKSIWNVLLGPWSRGAELVVHDGGFDAEQRFDLLQRLGVTVLCQAPTEYRLMAKVPGLEHFDLSRLRHAVSAGEPLNPEVIKLFRDAFGVTVLDGYGQTENTLLVANVRGAEIKPGSMGLPTPGHDVAVIDEEGREQAVGVEGDIALRGRPPSLFLGYWNAPEETSAVFRGEWYLTGDRATRDADGYLWFTGRADDVILSAAYRIGPFEVESALLEHPAVAESAVIGKPDPDRGEIVKAFVVLRPEIEPSAALVVELQDHVKAVTAPYKYPREIAFVDELPKTASGKIRRVELRRGEQALNPSGRPSVVAASTSASTIETSAFTAEQESPVETVSEAETVVALDAVQALDPVPGSAPGPALDAEVESREADDENVRRAAAELAVLEEARRLKEARAAEAAERAAAEAALRAERRADLERRTAEAAAAAAAAAEQARREEEQREAERAARAAREAEARLAAESAAAAEVAAQARQDEEREAARAAREADRAAREEQARLAAVATAAAEQVRRSEQDQREAAAAALPAPAPELTDRQRKAAEKQRREAEKAAAEQAKRDEADAKRAAEAKARDDERQRKEDEKRRREEEKAAAEQAKRDEAEAKRAAEAKARDDERQRKEDEKRRREEEKAAAEQAKRDEEARVRAERKAEEERRAAEAEQRVADERLRKEAERQRKDEERRRREAAKKPTLADLPEEDEFDDDEQRLNPALISRLRAYGRREDEEPAEDSRDADPPAA